MTTRVFLQVVLVLLEDFMALRFKKGNQIKGQANL